MASSRPRRISPGCEKLCVLNLRGTGYAARDFEWKEIRADLPDGTEVEVRARFAGLHGYLLSKCVAARRRGAAKDFYDFVYVLIYNAEGGPAAAATSLRGGNLAAALPELRSTFMEVRQRYVSVNDVGPREYATQMTSVDPAASEPTLRADAVAAVQEFFDALGF